MLELPIGRRYPAGVVAKVPRSERDRDTVASRQSPARSDEVAAAIKLQGVVVEVPRPPDEVMIGIPAAIHDRLLDIRYVFGGRRISTSCDEDGQQDGEAPRG